MIRPTSSEDQLQRELCDTRIERRRNRAEIGGPLHGVRGAEIRRVQQVEDLRTDLDGPTRAEGHPPHEREFRDRGIFYENVTNQILDDLVAALQPRRMTVVGDFSVRGGIKTIVTATYAAA